MESVEEAIDKFSGKDHILLLLFSVSLFHMGFVIKCILNYFWEKSAVVSQWLVQIQQHWAIWNNKNNSCNSINQCYISFVMETTWSQCKIMHILCVFLSNDQCETIEGYCFSISSGVLFLCTVCRGYFCWLILYYSKWNFCRMTNLFDLFWFDLLNIPKLALKPLYRVTMYNGRCK